MAYRIAAVRDIGSGSVEEAIDSSSQQPDNRPNQD
jgi:hypothetical protein